MFGKMIEGLFIFSIFGRDSYSLFILEISKFHKLFKNMEFKGFHWMEALFVESLNIFDCKWIFIIVIVIALR